MESGYEGYNEDYIPGDILPLINGFMQRDIDVDMESWHSYFPEDPSKGIVYGASRRGSCALTECFVFSRIAGKNGAERIFLS